MRKLSALIEDEELRKRLGEEGRRTVEERYSIKVNGPELKAVLEKAHESRKN